jgi:capsular polysaccharide biosynthesis protein
MSYQVTDLRSTSATLRRRRRLLAAAALVGLAAGVGYVIVQPPPLTSTTLVILPVAADEGSSSDVETQVRIVLSSTTLERAGQKVVPALPARRVEKMVDVSAPTNQIIQIDATSTDATKAQILSQAVADSYVGYVSDTAREVTATTLADLAHRRDQLQTHLSQLNKEIVATTRRQKELDPGSPEGKEEAQLLAGLRTQEANLGLQLDKVLDKIATGTPVGSTVGTGTSVIQHATEARGPSQMVRLLVWGPVGALVCTIIAAAVVLLAARRDPRVRMRDEIADAVGSPVLAAVRSRPQRSAAGWSTLLETYEATPAEAWAFRRLLRDSAPRDRKGEPHAAGNVDHPKSLTVVSLSGDRRGIAIGPQLAAFASSLGVATRLVATIGHETAATLWAACTTDHQVSGRPALYVGDVPDAEAIDLTIFLVVSDRSQPRLSDLSASDVVILCVASGTATEQELARVAVAVDDTGRRIDGIVVADPDQSDLTTGRHLMDERSRQLALPVRLTGIASSNGSAASDPHRIRP